MEGKSTENIVLLHGIKVSKGSNAFIAMKGLNGESLTEN